MPQSSTLGMNATLKNESPVSDTYTEKNPRFVLEGRWRMPVPLGRGSLLNLSILLISLPLLWRCTIRTFS